MAWVCCPIKYVLIRDIETSFTPEVAERVKMLEQIFGKRKDPLADELDAAIRAASTDAEKLTRCLRYVRHVYGRRRGHEMAESIVSRALKLPECGLAKGSEMA
jgi:hypothetical protein